jgi:hypothetical protein
MKLDKRRRRGGRRSIVGGNPADRTVSASRLAEMGFCERWVVLEQRHGSPRSRPLQAARERGLACHTRFERQGRVAMGTGTVPTTVPKGRCIVATLAFGEGWQTQTLRHFRDAVLRRRSWGRSIVYHYYRAGPRICAVLEASPALLGCMRWLLGQAARLWRWWAREAGR